MADLLTTSQACRFLSCSRRTIVNMVGRAQLVPVALRGPHGSLLFRRADLEQLLEPAPSDAQIIRLAHAQLAETQAEESRPLCPSCGQRRVSRGQSECLWCQQTRQAQLEHKRTWWDKHGSENRAQRRRQARRPQADDRATV